MILIHSIKIRENWRRYHVPLFHSTVLFDFRDHESAIDHGSDVCIFLLQFCFESTEENQFDSFELILTLLQGRSFWSRTPTLNINAGARRSLKFSFDLTQQFVYATESDTDFSWLQVYGSFSAENDSKTSRFRCSFETNRLKLDFIHFDSKLLEIVNWHFFVWWRNCEDLSYQTTDLNTARWDRLWVEGNWDELHYSRRTWFNSIQFVCGWFFWFDHFVTPICSKYSQ